MQKMIGMGVYGIPEVARYTGLNARRVYSWFRSELSSSGSSVFEADYAPVDNSYAVSFLDLIDVLMAGRLREQGVSLKDIRTAYHLLEAELNTGHPFCHSELYAHDGNIFALAANEVGDKTLIEVLSGQHFLRKVMQKYLKRIDHDPVTKLANRWRIAKGVVMNPSVSFGKPVVESTATTTNVLCAAYWANDRDVGLVAELFDLSPADISNAISFEEQLEARRAA